MILVVTAGGYALYQYFDGQIGRIRIAIGGDRPAAAAPGTENFLLVGSDSRAGTGNEFQSGGEVAGERSDTTMLAHLDADGSTTLVSFPRDTLVRIPGHGRDKLNAAVTLGGPTLLVQTIENLTDIKIDHYVSIDLAGFRKMTDAVGGVTVCVTRHPDGSTRNLNDEWSQWHGQLGDNHLDGDQALAFVRTRHALGDERLRIARQQQFLSKLLDKATSAGVLTNPMRLTELINAVGQSLEVDDGLSDEQMISLAGRLGQLHGVSFVTVPTHVPTRAEGASDDFGTISYHGNVLVYDPVPLAQLLAPLRPASENGDLAAGSSAAPALPPSQVVVSQVLNGSGRSGLAGETVDDLAALGFPGTPKAGTAAAGQMMTEVRYPPGQAAAAATLAAVIPGAITKEDPDAAGSGLVLVLGTSFAGVSGASGGAETAAGVSNATGSGGTTTTAGSAAAAVPAAPQPAPPADTSCTA